MMRLAEKLKDLLNKSGLLKKAVVSSLKFFAAVLSGIVLSVLWLISPFVTVKVGGLIGQRIGHLALNTDLFMRKLQLYGRPKKTKYFFIAGSIANEQMFTMWKRHLTIFRCRLLRGLFQYSTWMWKKTRFYEPLDMNSNEYMEFNEAKPTLCFTQEEEARGKAFLRKMGINPETDWFVCVFARDSVYVSHTFSNKFLGKKDWSYHDYRNADINTYKPAIDHIVKMGGYVVRIGFHVEQALNYKSDKVIDYATEYRDDFMDIYLVAKCRFFLGNSSGIADVANVFDVPRVCVNTAPPYVAPFSKHSIFIPKKLKDPVSGKYVPYSSFITNTKSYYSSILWYGQEAYNAGYEYEDNTEDEILEATKEMCDRLDGKFQQSDEDRALQEKYFQLFSHDHWAKSIKTPVGASFIKENRPLFEVS